MVERALARLAVAAREHGIRRIVVAGGESSGAVAQGLYAINCYMGTRFGENNPRVLSNFGRYADRQATCTLAKSQEKAPYRNSKVLLF